MSNIHQLIAKHKRGELTLAPFAEVVIYPSTKLIGTLDIQNLKSEFQKARQKYGIGFSTRQLITPSTIRSNVGTIDSLSISMKSFYGGEFNMSVLDLEAGRQMQRLFERIRRGGRLVTAFGVVRTGWISSNEDRIISPELHFLVKDITTSYDGGQFVYNITGISMAAPFFMFQVIREGKFKGTVGQCLSEWERITGFTIKNKEIVKLDELIQTTDNLIGFNAQSPKVLLDTILQYAKPKIPSRDQRIEYTVDINDQVVYLHAFGTLHKVFRTYVVGSPDSDVIDVSMKDDLSLSKIASLQSHMMDVDSMKDEERGSKDTSSKTSTVVSPVTTLTNGPAAKSQGTPATNNLFSPTDIREGTVTVVGDPELMLVLNSKIGRQIYTQQFPFLGIRLNVHQVVPSNLMTDSHQVSVNHWLNGIYRVKNITHTLDSTEYRTVLDVQGDIASEQLFGG